MRPRDLMIDDWVFDSANEIYWQVNHKDFRNNDCQRILGDFEPIPITPEILEKNFREYLPGIKLMYQLKGPYFAMNEEGNQWVFGLVKEDGEKSCRYPLVKITYVHELQHALRLCGIEKTIEL